MAINVAIRNPEVLAALELALDAQELCWRGGERIPVEDYLARYSILRDDSEAILDLVYQEYLLRRRLGEHPEPDEFVSRFPHLAEPLLLQFGADAVIPQSAGSREGDEHSKQDVFVALKNLRGYEIIGELGRGGMGVVYEARDKALGRLVALKIIAGGSVAHVTQRRRFEVEARAAARLQHHNILQIHEIGEHEGCLFLVLEFAEGGSLAQQLVDKPQPPLAAAGLVETLARAVQVAHDHKIIHRDLKPSNVLLTADDIPKISDFGLAKLVDENSSRTQTGDLLGTPSFMAPEQAEGRTREVGRAADIYSLGAILYQALTGRPPFLGGSTIETLNQVVSTEVVPPRSLRPDVPRDLETICLKCLEKSPNGRYATALDLADDLRRFQRDEVILAKRAGVIDRSRKWVKRHPWPTASATIATISVLGFIGLFYRHNVQLRAEVKRTSDKADEAKRNGEQALTNYQEARSAIQKMLGRLQDSRVAGIPRLLDLQKEMREDAMAFYETILSHVDETTDVVVRADNVRTLGELAIFQETMRHSSDAVTSLRRALGLMESLRSQQPNNQGFQRLQADLFMKLGPPLCTLNKHDEAFIACEAAIALFTPIANAAPDSPADQEMLAICHNNCGIALAGLKRNREALVQFQQAIKIREHIEPSKLPGVTQRLALTLMNAGFLFWAEKDFSNAENHFGKAESLLLSVPENQRMIGEGVDFAIGQLNLNWGGMLQTMGRYKDALERGNAGLIRIEPKLAIEPNDASLRELCYQLHGNRAYALMGLERPGESAKEWERVIELAPHPVPVGFRVRLSIALVSAGDVARALSQAELLQVDSSISAGDRYDLSCVYALAATAIRRDHGLDVSERGRLVESRVSKSFRWLETASRAGLFDDPAQREHAKRDPDLDILRERPEFLQLIEVRTIEPVRKRDSGK
jgi:serine/threonine protein kinase